MGGSIWHLVIGKDKIESEPKTLTIGITKEWQSNRTSKTQTEQPVQLKKAKNPNQQQGNDPKHTNESITDGYAPYEKAIFPAVFKITARAPLMTVKKIF
jgi:hypothetical protein